MAASCGLKHTYSHMLTPPFSLATFSPYRQGRQLRVHSEGVNNKRAPSVIS
jgi:hypothetical protein